MPSLYVTAGTLTRLGPLIDIEVLPSNAVASKMKASGQPIRPVPARALIDTGASNSVIKQGLLPEKDLDMFRRVLVRTPVAPAVSCPRYGIRIRIPGSEHLVPVAVVEARMPNSPYDLIIGRDMLQRAVFLYIGSMNSFTLSFPDTSANDHTA